MTLKLFTDGQPLWTVRLPYHLDFVVRVKQTSLPIEEVKRRLKALPQSIPPTYAEELAPGKVLLLVTNIAYDRDGTFPELPQDAEKIRGVVQELGAVGFVPDYVHDGSPNVNLPNFMYSIFYDRMFYVDQDIFDVVLTPEGLSPSAETDRKMVESLGIFDGIVQSLREKAEPQPSSIVYHKPQVPFAERVASLLAPLNPKGYHDLYDWLYHSAYEASIIIGGQTWGQNAPRLASHLNQEMINQT